MKIAGLNEWQHSQQPGCLGFARIDRHNAGNTAPQQRHERRAIRGVLHEFQGGLRPLVCQPLECGHGGYELHQPAHPIKQEDLGSAPGKNAERHPVG